MMCRDAEANDPTPSFIRGHRLYVYMSGVTLMPEGSGFRTGNACTARARAHMASNKRIYDDANSRREWYSSFLEAWKQVKLSLDQAPTPQITTAMVLAPPPLAQITVPMVLGEYRYSPYQNGWHIGWIEQDSAGLLWRNQAGARWRLTPDFANKQLRTETDNPYYTQGRREFKLLDSNGRIMAFQFGNETYTKQ